MVSNRTLGSVVFDLYEAVRSPNQHPTTEFFILPSSFNQLSVVSHKDIFKDFVTSAMSIAVHQVMVVHYDFYCGTINRTYRSVVLLYNKQLRS